MTTFSIVTPSFRQVGYLALCARSVEDQVAPDIRIEHIIQEGGGGEEFDSWANLQTFPDIHVESDSGMYDAINRGFLRAEGEILAWLNCDEQYLTGTLAKVSQWFTENPDKDVLFGDIVILDSAGCPISYRKALTPMRPHIRSCHLATFSAATFIRRKIIDEGLLLDTRFRTISDAVWIDAILGKGYKCGVLNQPLATFMQTGGNLGQSTTAMKEGDEWQLECKADGLLRRAFWQIIHRLRKMAHGCYVQRQVELEIYADNESRRVLRAARIGGLWSTDS